MNDAYASKITPNFLHSILTNDTLYNMFKDDYENNIDYFKNLPKESYIFEIEKYICSSLKGGILQMDSYRRFYDDFILPKIEEKEDYLFNVELFKILKQVYKSNDNITNKESFLSFYNYIFTSSKYFARCDDFLNHIRSINGKINASDYEMLSNYIKNTVDEHISMDIVCLLIKNHIYKYNHIFDSLVVKQIVKSIAYSFLKEYAIDVNIEYVDIMLSKNAKMYDMESHTIYLETILIDTFISGNYVELLSSLFFKVCLFKDDYLLKNDIVDYNALKCIWRCINAKVEMDKIFVDEKYRPYDYYSEVESNAFIMTLRFLASIGIDLFRNYIKSQSRDIDFVNVESKNSPKAISEEMRFINRFSKMEKEKIAHLRTKYRVLSLIYDASGKRYKAIELINKSDSSNRNLIFDYLSSSIFEPICLIDDVIDLSGQKFNNEIDRDFACRLMKYIIPDMFYYSLESYIMMNEDKVSFDKETTLSELYVRTSSIIENADTHNFLKSALQSIELMKQKD